MDIVKKSIKETIERLEGLEFYESWTDGKLFEILDKLKSVEKDVQNLQDTVRNARTMPSLKEIGTADIISMNPIAWNGSVTPDYRDQWRYDDPSDFKLHREIIKMSDRTETAGDVIAEKWAKFMETASPDEKVKALTEIIRTLTPGTSV